MKTPKTPDPKTFHPNANQASKLRPLPRQMIRTLHPRRPALKRRRARPAGAESLTPGHGRSVRAGDGFQVEVGLFAVLFVLRDVDGGRAERASRAARVGGGAVEEGCCEDCYCAYEVLWEGILAEGRDMSIPACDLRKR